VSVCWSDRTARTPSTVKDAAWDAKRPSDLFVASVPGGRGRGEGRDIHEIETVAHARRRRVRCVIRLLAPRGELENAHVASAASKCASIGAFARLVVCVR
jgi:hypothetical protein